jgi:hypothetical protein
MKTSRFLSKFLSITIGVMAMLHVTGVYAKGKVVYEKKTKIDFEEKNVDGQFMTPEGSDVKADQNVEFDSLLNPKANFKKELRRDAGAVR